MCMDAGFLLPGRLLVEGCDTVRHCSWEGSLGWPLPPRSPTSNLTNLVLSMCPGAKPRMMLNFGKHLAATLPSYCALEDVQLRFQDSGVILDQEVDDLCQACVQLPRLRRLRLDVSGNQLCANASSISISISYFSPPKKRSMSVTSVKASNPWGMLRCWNGCNCP